MADYEAVIRTADLGPGQKVAVTVHDRDVVLVNVGQTYFALDAYCPNDGVNLGEEGHVEGEFLVCPEDGWAFDVRTGFRERPTPGPGLHRYAIRVEDNEVKIGPPLPGWRAGAA